MSTSLLRVVERARREPEGRFHSLAHLIEVPALERAFHRLRADAAVGVDGVSKEDYGQELEANLVELHKRLKAKRYRHQPLRRVHIPKGGGRTRPIGISAVEDKIVQEAVREVLEAVYEQDFLECSYGFRPGRSAHDAIRALNRAVYQGKVSWILEADIESFFDSLDRTRLEEMLRIRVADGSLRRLVGKCVRVGVLDGEERTEPERGTPQGSGLSPTLWERSHNLSYGNVPITTVRPECGVPLRPLRARFVRRLPPSPSSPSTGISNHALMSPSIRPSLTRRARLFINSA